MTSVPEHPEVRTTVSEERLAEIIKGCEGVTPGPWDVWMEPTPSKDQAIDELAHQVNSTPDADFAEAVYLLNANGKCPATTGCGPSSAANAKYLARLDPQTVLSLLTELQHRREAEAGGGVALIVAERQRQVDAEGWTPEHDDQHMGGELAHAGACYALGRTELRLEGVTTHFWPWDRSWWKPKDRLSDLVRAGALIAAEIDRLLRVGDRS